jgi:hypothetical protein
VLIPDMLTLLGRWASARSTFLTEWDDVFGKDSDGLVAPWVIDRPMNRKTFDIYVETQLAPTLQKGDEVILDNLPSHKNAKAEAILKQRGASFLFLPPYSPGPQSDRDGRRQAQGPSPAHRRKNHRCPLEGHRR